MVSFVTLFLFSTFRALFGANGEGGHRQACGLLGVRDDFSHGVGALAFQMLLFLSVIVAFQAPSHWHEDTSFLPAVSLSGGTIFQSLACTQLLAYPSRGRKFGSMCVTNHHYLYHIHSTIASNWETESRMTHCAWQVTGCKHPFYVLRSLGASRGES